MKKELNLLSDLHMEIIQEICFKSLNGTKVTEIFKTSTNI